LIFVLWVEDGDGMKIIFGFICDL